jgi:hypothetical protein
MRQEKFIVTKCTGDISELPLYARSFRSKETSHYPMDLVSFVDASAGIVTGYCRGVLITIRVAPTESITWISPTPEGLF